MIDKLHLLRTVGKPWLLSTKLPLTALGEVIERLTEDSGFACRTLDGSKMGSWEAVFSEFATELEFPDYFGFNDAALSDCLRDLEWLAPFGELHPPGFLTVITRAELVFSNTPDELSYLLKILSYAADTWNNESTEAPPFAREGVPFHCVFHADFDSHSSLSAAILALPELT